MLLVGTASLVTIIFVCIGVVYFCFLTSYLGNELVMCRKFLASSTSTIAHHYHCEAYISLVTLYHLLWFNSSFGWSRWRFTRICRSRVAKVIIVAYGLSVLRALGSNNLGCNTVSAKGYHFPLAGSDLIRPTRGNDSNEPDTSSALPPQLMRGKW